MPVDYDNRELHNVCNRKVKSEKATTFLIWMIPLFSDHYQSPQFCFTVANILQSSVRVLGTVAAL